MCGGEEVVTKMEINSQRTIYQRLFHHTLLMILYQLVYNLFNPIALHDVLQVFYRQPESVVSNPILGFKTQWTEFLWAEHFISPGRNYTFESSRFDPLS